MCVSFRSARERNRTADLHSLNAALPLRHTLITCHFGFGMHGRQRRRHQAAVLRRLSLNSGMCMRFWNRQSCHRFCILLNPQAPMAQTNRPGSLALPGRGVSRKIDQCRPSAILDSGQSDISSARFIPHECGSRKFQLAGAFGGSVWRADIDFLLEAGLFNQAADIKPENSNCKPEFAGSDQRQIVTDEWPSLIPRRTKGIPRPRTGRGNALGVSGHLGSTRLPT